MVAGPISVDVSSLVEIVDNFWVGDDIAVFHNGMFTTAVHGTSRVEVDVPTDVHVDNVEAVLVGYVMRTLFRHAGVFSLHASLVQFGGDATGHTVAIAGHSRAGKSTTVSHAAATLDAKVLVDDVLPVTMVDGVAIAHPYRRPVHIRPEAAVRLGLDPAAATDDPTVGFRKLITESTASPGPVQLDHLVVLQVADADAADPLVVRSVRGAERLRMVVAHSNVTGVSSFGANADRFVQWATQLAASTAVTEIIRRPGDDTLDEVARLVAQRHPAHDDGNTSVQA